MTLLTAEWGDDTPWGLEASPQTHCRAGQPWKPRCSSLRALDVIAGSTVPSDGTVCPRDPSTSGLSLLFTAFPKRAPSFPAVPDKPLPHPVRGLPFLLSKCVSALGAADGRSLGHVSGPRSVKGGWERGGFLASVLGKTHLLENALNVGRVFKRFQVARKHDTCRLQMGWAFWGWVGGRSMEEGHVWRCRASKQNHTSGEPEQFGTECWEVGPGGGRSHLRNSQVSTQWSATEAGKLWLTPCLAQGLAHGGF